MVVSVQSQNYFDLFGLTKGFVVDLGKLSEQYRELQKAVHPDRFANASEQERRISVQQAGLINEAYETLKDPLRRAQYLLVLDGVDYKDQQHTLNDPTFLMQQMELREQLSEIPSKQDPLETLSEMMDSVDQDIVALIHTLEHTFNEGSVTALDEAASLVQKLQFMYKIREEMENTEAALEDQY